jgi:hypothetical protein
MKSRVFILTALGLATIVGAALAEEAIFEIDSAVAISSPDGATTRFLVWPQVEFPDSNQIVDWARLEFWVEPTTEDTTTFISILVYPITTEWNPGNAAWDSPWSNPGGDFDEDIYAEYWLPRSE